MDDGFVLRDMAKERMFYSHELALLAELSGELRVVDWHGDFHLEQPFDSSLASKRMIGGHLHLEQY